MGNNNNPWVVVTENIGCTVIILAIIAALFLPIIFYSYKSKPVSEQQIEQLEQRVKNLEGKK